MSNDVDPFVIRWPQKWAQDVELRPTLTYLNRFLHDLWIRTGGGDDFIFNIGVDITALEIRVALLEAEMDAVELRLDALEALQFIEVTATANHTTTRNEIVTCTNTALITITLDASPDALEEVHIVRAGSVVKINGNGNSILGLYGSTGVSEVTLNGIGQAAQLIYNATTTNWHIQ